MSSLKPLPTLDELRDLFIVNFETGQLFWREREDDPQWSAKFAGRLAGSQDCRGYIRVQIGRGKIYLAHRIIFKMAYNLEPEMIDHVDRNKANNQLLNLRSADNTINKHNQKLSGNNTSGCTGVYLIKSRNRWIVKSPKTQGRSKNVGYFKSKEEAIAHRVGLYGESFCF